MDDLLKIEDLKISYYTYAGEVQSVRGVSFSVRKGETLAIVGESGCGKSVTAKSIMGLIQVPPGEIKEGSKILLKGKNLLEQSEKEWESYRGARCAMVFQDALTALNPTMRIGKQIAENITNHQKAGKDEVKKRVLEMLRLVMIATALAGNPEILIADEPTTALDVTIQAQIMDLLAEIQQKLGMTVILITHDLGVVANSADRVVVMYSGKVVETGTCTEIFEKHKHPYTWALLKAAPDMELGSKQKLVAIEGTPPDLILPPKGCPFAERCGHCMKICLETEAPRYTFSKDHSVFCWLYHPESGYTDITFDEGEIE